MKRRRIAVSVINDVRADGRVHKVCTSLAEAGYAVTCFSRPTAVFDWDEPPPYRVVWLEGLPPAGKGMYVRFMGALWRRLRQGNFDLLWANDLDTLAPAVLAARHTPVIYDTHEYFTGMAELAGRPLERWVWRTLERLLFHRPKAVVTVNESVARRYEAEYGRSLHVLYNYPLRADRRRSTPPTLSPPIRLLYQGALQVGRGLEMMVDALAMLPDDFHLDIVGGGPLRPALEARVRERGLAGRVAFHGHVPFFRLPHYTARAHIGLSIESPQFTNSAISLPNKLLDYLNQGLPVVVAGLPEHRRLVERWKVGRVMEEYSPGALAHAAAELAASEADYRRLAENAFRAVDTALSWEAQLPRLLQIVEDALES